MIVESSKNPDIKGSSTSVRTRSILNDFSFSISHALTPSEAAETVGTKTIHKYGGKKGLRSNYAKIMAQEVGEPN
jgi:hypothetical protein